MGNYNILINYIIHWKTLYYYKQLSSKVHTIILFIYYLGKILCYTNPKLVHILVFHYSIEHKSIFI